MLKVNINSIKDWPRDKVREATVEVGAVIGPEEGSHRTQKAEEEHRLHVNQCHDVHVVAQPGLLILGSCRFKSRGISRGEEYRGEEEKANVLVHF